MMDPPDYLPISHPSTDEPRCIPHLEFLRQQVIVHKGPKATMQMAPSKHHRIISQYQQPEQDCRERDPNPDGVSDIISHLLLHPDVVTQGVDGDRIPIRIFLDQPEGGFFRETVIAIIQRPFHFWIGVPDGDSTAHILHRFNLPFLVVVDHNAKLQQGCF